MLCIVTPEEKDLLAGAEDVESDKVYKLSTLGTAGESGAILTCRNELLHVEAQEGLLEYAKVQTLSR